MRILLWAPFGAGTHYWGPGTSAYRLYKNNKDQNIKVTLVHGSDEQGIFPEVFDEQVQIGTLKKNSIISTIFYLIKSYRWIRRNHRKYDVFHGITAYAYTFIPALFFQGYRKPAYIKITGLHGGFGRNSRVSRITGISSLRIKRANTLAGYISISSDITASLERSGVKEKKITYIPNGVDTVRFHPVSAETKAALRKNMDVKEAFTICYVGGLTKNKRVLEIVKAVHHLVKSNYRVQFFIVGPDRSDGIVENEINHYLWNNNLQDYCIRINHTTQPEMYFNISDLFILNSEFEGLSNSLLEAMACGLPCVASPASGTVDVVEDNTNGFLTDGSFGQIEEKIRVIYKNKQLHISMSSQARRKINEGYSVDFVLAEHLRLFKRRVL